MSEDYIQIEEEEEKKDTGQDVSERKKQLWLVMGLSALLDIIISAGTLTAGFVIPGTNIIVDEVIENLISRVIARLGLKEDLDWTDQVIGLIPIPGVTAITVRCSRELFKLYSSKPAAE